MKNVQVIKMPVLFRRRGLANVGIIKKGGKSAFGFIRILFLAATILILSGSITVTASHTLMDSWDLIVASSFVLYQLINYIQAEKNTLDSHDVNR